MKRCDKSFSNLLVVFRSSTFEKKYNLNDSFSVDITAERFLFNNFESDLVLINKVNSTQIAVHINSTCN